MAHQSKFSIQVTRTSYQKLGSNRACSILSTEFLVPYKTGTRMHNRLAKLLVRDSGELGSYVSLQIFSWVAKQILGYKQQSMKHHCHTLQVLLAT